VKKMVKLSYYPGCTLKADARHFEESAVLALRELGVELEELKRWNCCGTVFSLATDNTMHHLAPLRNLLRVREEGHEKLFTLCSMCFNTLTRANRLFRDDPAKNEKVRNIMYEEVMEYDGRAIVLHLLTLLRDEIGLETLREKTNGGLKGLMLAPYYGCMLLRPDGMGVDDVENPHIFEDVLGALGAEATSFPFRAECCGSYQTVQEPEIVAERTYIIIGGARKAGADAVVVSCPLCAFNLDIRQSLTAQRHADFESLPVFYITECMCLALGLGFKEEWRALHHVPVDSVIQRFQSKK
jgi:heterodisulfide reductase subunit B